MKSMKAMAYWTCNKSTELISLEALNTHKQKRKVDTNSSYKQKLQ